MSPTTPPPGFYFFVAIFWLVVVCTVLMVLFKVAVWWGERRPMSNSERGSQLKRTSFDGGFERFPLPVLGQQNQERANRFAAIEDIINLTYTSPVTDQQALTILALMRRENGEYFLSANKIRDIVGGADATVKAEVAALRPSKPAPPVVRSIARPPGGWPKSA